MDWKAVKAIEIYRLWQRIQNESATNRIVYRADLASKHEGFALLLEEVDELWDEVKKKESDPIKMKEEAIQIIVMAFRFIIDICPTVKRDTKEAK